MLSSNKNQYSFCGMARRVTYQETRLGRHRNSDKLMALECRHKGIIYQETRRELHRNSGEFMVVECRHKHRLYQETMLEPLYNYVKAESLAEDSA